MDRKKNVLTRGMCLALAFLAIPYMVWAQTTTVGANNGLKANGVNSMTVIPNQPNTPTCFSVNVNSVTATQILAADAKRAAIWIENTSSVPLTTVANKVDNQPPIVYLFFSNTVPLPNGAANAYAKSQSMLAIPIYPCSIGNNSGGSPSGACQWSQQDVSVYRGALWAVAQQSTDTSSNGNAPAWVQGCYLDP